MAVLFEPAVLSYMVCFPQDTLLSPVVLWIRELSPVKVSEKEEITSKEYEKMKRRIAELEMENEILKKATAIFARKR